MYQIEKGKPFYMALWSLSLTYNYSDKNGKIERKIYVVTSILARLTGALVPIGLISHLTHATKYHTGVKTTQDISFIPSFIGAMISGILFSINQKKWSEFFKILTDTKEFNTPPSYEKTVKFTNLVNSYYYYFYCLGGTATYIIYAIYYSYQQCKRFSGNTGEEKFCGIATPLWLPFESNFILVVVINIVETISIYMVIPASAIICSVPRQATEILISKIDHLKILLQHATQSESVDEMISEIKTCVKYHQRILKLANELNIIARSTTGYMSAISAIIFGCIATEMLQEATVGSVLFLNGYVIAMFEICHAGQRLLDETESVRDAVFATKWYRAPGTVRRDLSLMILRCQKPVYLDALPLGASHYVLFATIVKASYSYLTLLNR